MKRILVPFDGSAAGTHACNEAVELAGVFGAELVLLQVIEPSPYFLQREVTDEIREMVHAELERSAARLRPRIGAVRTMVAEGRPWDKIVEAAKEVDADLVAMGTHGRGGLSRAIMGSVAERVVRLAEAPVLTVPEHVFVDRTDAAVRLLRSLEPLGLASPAVVALSRGALIIANVVARALAGTTDLWLVAPLTDPNGRTIGALGEDGTISFASEPAPDAATRSDAEARGRRAIEDELGRLRGTRAMGPTADRPIVVVSDGLADPSVAIVAAEAMRALGPRELILAAPLVSPATLAAAAPLFDRVVCVHRPLLTDCLSSYEDDRLPSDRDARALLESTARAAQRS